MNEVKMPVGWFVWWYCIHGDAEVMVEQRVDEVVEAWPLSTLLRVCDMQEEVSIKVLEQAERNGFRGYGL